MNAYVHIAWLRFLTQLTYRADLIVGGFMSAIYVLIFYFIWRALSGGEPIIGLTFAAFMWYIGFAQIMFATQGDPVSKVSEDIQSGMVAIYLVRPFSFFWYIIAESFGSSVVALVTSAFWIGLLLTFLVGMPVVPLAAIPAILLISLLGVLIAYLLMFCIGCFAFWFEDATPYKWIYDKIVFIFAGMLFPLDLYPTWLQGIGKALPTAYLMYWPSYLFANFSWAQALHVLIGQGLYLIVLTFVVIFVLKAGLRKVVVHGG